MKFTLAYGIYNKGQWIESLLDSWISNLSGENEYEIIMVFDDCRDDSEIKSRRYLQQHPYEYKFLYADDRFELFCNNLALENATGDYIIFIQDDNWIHDKDWDLLLSQVVERVPDLGAIALLAGLELSPPAWESSGALGQIKSNVRKVEKVLKRALKPGRPPSTGPDTSDWLCYERIEIDRPHKGEFFQEQGVKHYDLGVWQVDAVNRPFGVSRELLVSLGGLDKAFMPSCGDDMDLSIKLLQRGKTNIYIPFDLVNTCGSKETRSYSQRDENFTRAMSINSSRYSLYIASRSDRYTEMIMPLEVSREGELKLAETIDPT